MIPIISWSNPVRKYIFVLDYEPKFMSHQTQFKNCRRHGPNSRGAPPKCLEHLSQDLVLYFLSGKPRLRGHKELLVWSIAVAIALTIALPIALPIALTIAIALDITNPCLARLAPSFSNENTRQRYRYWPIRFEARSDLWQILGASSTSISSFDRMEKRWRRSPSIGKGSLLKCIPYKIDRWRSSIRAQEIEFRHASPW